MSLQVLGQTVLEFDLSIAQILVAVVVAGALDGLIHLRRTGVLLWPSSALLTGNSVAFILRVPGTEHGDWWTLEGWWIFAAAAAVSVLSKYVLRSGGSHLFNPSNLGLVVAFVALGANRADPQDLWWGDLDPGLALTLAVIAIGAAVILRRLRMVGLAAAFLVTFLAGAGLLAASGHCMTARWHIGPVCDGSYWWTLATSPEIFVFTAFMITDPKTAPRGRMARAVFGVAIAVVATLLIAPAQSEFVTKVGILGALVIVCAATPFLGRRWPAVERPADRPTTWLRHLRPAHVIAGLLGLAVVGGGLLAAGGRARTIDGASFGGIEDRGTRRVTAGMEAPEVVSVRVSPAVRAEHPEITDSVAGAMVDDVARDLVMVAAAREEHDVGLARGAVAGPAAGELERDVSRDRAAGRVTVTEYSFTRGMIVFAKREETQASPEPAVELRGSVRTTVHRGSSTGEVLSQTSASFRRVLFVFRVDGRGPFVIRDEVPPDA